MQRKPVTQSPLQQTAMRMDADDCVCGRGEGRADTDLQMQHILLATARQGGSGGKVLLTIVSISLFTKYGAAELAMRTFLILPYF